MGKGNPVGINLEELMTGVLTRTRYVHRWSTFHTLHKESVAEHSFFVSFYALAICNWLLVERKFVVNVYEVIARTLVHDLDEAYSGDFIRSFKHSSPDLKEALDHAAARFHEQICYRIAPNSVGALMHEFWKVAKDDSLEGRVVAFCDFLSVTSYALLECQGGNRHISEEKTHLSEYAAFFQGPEYDFLQPLPAEALELIREVVK